MAQRKPSLSLQAELVFPDGTTKRLDCDARSVLDEPSGVSFKTQRYTGFADASLTLNRPIGKEYTDLGLLSGLNLIGYDGSVAYEGRVASMPRTLEGSPKIMLMAQGWMSHARDQPFVECFIDRDLSKWGQPSATEVARVAAANFSLGSVGTLTDATGTPCVELSFQGSTAAPYKPVSEACWLPKPGINLGILYYSFASYNTATMAPGDANWKVHSYLSTDDKFLVSDASAGLFPGPTSGYLTATAERKAAMLQLYYEATPSGASGATYYGRFTKLAVYGTHGLPGKGVDPLGFYVSDIIKNIASRWAPKLDTSLVRETTFPVPQASFLEETLPYDAFQTLNVYHRWELAVYEERKLRYWPMELTDYDWEVRESDPGVTSSLQGDDLEHLCNGVVVRFTNLATGYEERLTPSTSAQLKDENPDNPANKYGIPAYTTLALSVPTTAEGALQIGRIYLTEFNRAKAPGTITIHGHVRDRAGHLQPVWKMRSSERLIVSDLPNDRVRVIGETSYDHDNKTVTIAVDSTMKKLDAILARLGVAVEASGLSLP